MTIWNVWSTEQWQAWQRGTYPGRPLGYRRSEQAAFALAGILAAARGKPVIVSREWGLADARKVTPKGTIR